MEKVRNFGDDRNKGWCVHCGGPNETRDHAPSIIFLDDPLPPDLSASPSCTRCNHGFSNDEAYLACLLECVMAGSADPDRIERAKVAALMRRRPALTAELAAARRENKGEVLFTADQPRITNIVLKLARCHAAYELNEPRTDQPVAAWFAPLALLDPAAREEFEDDNASPGIWPEVGSRAMMRMLVSGIDVFGGGWLDVQPERYRYRISQEDRMRIRIVIREYLACEVVWD